MCLNRPKVILKWITFLLMSNRQKLSCRLLSREGCVEAMCRPAAQITVAMATPRGTAVAQLLKDTGKLQS